MGNHFLDGSSVRAESDGRYRADIDDVWTLRPLPQGGFVAALALRAMQQHLDDPAQTLRSFHTTFVAPVAQGPVTIDVELLRRGRTLSHLQAEVRSEGAEHGHLTTAVFGGPRRGFAFTDLEPPVDVAPWAECVSFRDPLPEGVEGFEPMRFWEEILEGRAGSGHPPWEEYEPDRAEHATWYRFDQPPLLADGELDPLALPVLVDTMPGAVAEKLGPGANRDWWGPSVDLTMHLFAPTSSTWLLAHNTARHAGDGYASADMALWDRGDDGTAAPRLIAYATQVFVFQFPD